MRFGICLECKKPKILKQSGSIAHHARPVGEMSEDPDDPLCGGSDKPPLSEITDIELLTQLNAKVLKNAEHMLSGMLISNELSEKTDLEFADVLFEQWSKLDMFSEESEMVSQLVDRLRRASGGVLEYTDEGKVVANTSLVNREDLKLMLRSLILNDASRRHSSTSARALFDRYGYILDSEEVDEILQRITEFMGNRVQADWAEFMLYVRLPRSI